MALGDYNNDGRLDVFIAENSRQGRIALLHNEGDGLFVDQTIALQVEPAGHRRGVGTIFGDYDNDGDLDLFISLWELDEDNTNILVRNDRGIFREITQEAGVDARRITTDNAIWLDYDRDGYLDLYVNDESGPEARNILYRNKGDGTFEDVTQQAGLHVQFHAMYGGSLGGMAAADFNDDGWPDLYLAVFQDRNRLLINDGQGGFEDATTGEIDDEGEAFGVAVGDIDNDGDMDIFQAAGGSNEVVNFRSVLLENLGGGVFLDVLEGSGLSALADGRFGEPVFADFDNDGDLDLLISGGVSSEMLFFFLNNGDGTFVEATDQLGAERGVNSAVGDFNGDGALDFVTSDFVEPAFYYIIAATITTGCGWNWWGWKAIARGSAPG